MPACFTRYCGHLAAGQAPGADHPPIGAIQLAAALLSEPEGLAAKAIGQAGVTPGQVYAALGTGVAPQLPNTDKAAPRELTFDDSAKATFREALKWALRLSHNYIGTEHLLLGAVFTDDQVAGAFTTLGLPPQRARS